jgi:hypothetical protein
MSTIGTAVQATATICSLLVLALHQVVAVRSADGRASRRWSFASAVAVVVLVLACAARLQAVL